VVTNVAQKFKMWRKNARCGAKMQDLAQKKQDVAEHQQNTWQDNGRKL